MRSRSNMSVWISGAAVGALLFLAGLVAGAPDASAEDLTVRITQGACGCAAPLSVAIKKGFLDDELRPLHVKLAFEHLETGPAQTAALQSGSLDIGLYGAAAVALIANQVPIKIFMMADNPSGGEGLAVKAGISSMQDLQGKRIAAPLGTSGDVMLRGALDAYHISLDKVTLVNLDPPALAAAWERNDIQGAYIWDPWFSRLAGMDGHKLVTDGQVVADSHGKYNAGWDVWLARSAFAAQHPDVMRALVRAFDKGARFIASNPEESAALIYTLHGASSAQQMLAQLREDSFPPAAESRSDTWLGTSAAPGRLPEAFMSIWQVMYDSGKVRTRPSLEAVKRTIDPQYLR